MNKLLTQISLLALLSMSLSCQNKKIFKGKDITMECKTMFQDLQKHVVRLDSNFIDFVVLNKKNTKKEEYIEFSQNMLFRLRGERRDCVSSFAKEDIIKLFGNPNSSRSKIDSWFYVFPFGEEECPCYDCYSTISYGGCNYINFRFDENGNLIRLFLDPSAMKWE